MKNLNNRFTNLSTNTKIKIKKKLKKSTVNMKKFSKFKKIIKK